MALKILLGLLIWTSTIASASAPKFQFIGRQGYFRLTNSERDTYIRQIRKVLIEFESAIHAGDENSYAFLRLVPEAEAASAWGNQCVVGGQIRPTVGGRCPTFGNECAGQSGSFKCGDVFGGICVARHPIGSLSKRCDAGKADPTPEAYSQFSSNLEQGLNSVCSAPNKRTAVACSKSRDQLSRLKESYDRPAPPQPPVPAPTPAPDPANGQFSAVKEGACRRSRNQGQLGTCHAFCLTCVYDNAIAKKTGNSNFKSSENWIAMLSVVERMCDDHGSAGLMSDELLTKGWWPGRNLHFLSGVGACSESNFIPYVGATGDWAAQFRASGLIQNPDKGNNSRGLNQTFHAGSNFITEFTQEEQQRWSNRFGIKPKEAWDLFCPGNKSVVDSLHEYGQRLSEMKGRLNPQFAKCAEEALKNKEGLGLDDRSKACTESSPTANSPNAVEDIKAMLKRANGPIPITIQTDVSGHKFHCVTLTGYDDTTRKFKMVNSWGTSREFESMSYEDAAKKIVDAAGVSCPLVTGRVSATATPSVPPAAIE